MSVLRVSAASRERIKVEVQTSADPTGTPLVFAYVQDYVDVDDTDWYDGEWEEDADGTWWACALVGPSEAPGSGEDAGTAAHLERGSWLVYVSWENDSTDEEPCKLAGTLEVF
jgi:hypothetical protein